MRAVLRLRFIACIQIQSFSRHFIFLHLSTLPRSDFPGSYGQTLPTCFVLSARTTKVFFMYSFMAYGNFATIPKRLETELTTVRVKDGMSVAEWHVAWLAE